MAKKKRRAVVHEQKAAPLPRHLLMLALVAKDRTFEAAQTRGAGALREVWQGKCIHCRSALVVDPARPNAGVATVEHIVPLGLGGGHIPDNLALACARCNNQKGSRLDPLGLGDPRLQAVVQRLQVERLKRHRTPPAHLQLPEAVLLWLGLSRPLDG